MWVCSARSNTIFELNPVTESKQGAFPFLCCTPGTNSYTISLNNEMLLIFNLTDTEVCIMH